MFAELKTFCIFEVSKQTDMTTTQFLSENREEIINFYNKEVKNYWTISLRDFGTDLSKNFRKISIKKELTKMDLNGNLKEAQSRLGMFNKTSVEVSYSKPYSESNHAKAVNYYGAEKVNQFKNI